MNMKFNEVKVGPWLKSWMETHKKNAIWLGDVLNMTHRQARKYTEERSISVDNLRRISKATGVDLFVRFLSDESKAIYDKGWELLEEERKAKLAKEEETKLQMAERQVEDLQKQISALQEMVVKMSKPQ